MNYCTDFPIYLYSVFEELCHVLLLRNICFKEGRVQLLGNLIADIAVGVRNYHFGTQTQQEFHCRQPEARGTSCHHSHEVTINLHVVFREYKTS